MRVKQHLPSATFGLAILLLYGAASQACAQDLAAGRKLAEDNCARCHAIAQKQQSPHPDAPPFRVIAGKGNVDNLQEALAEGIMVGHADMPEFQLEPKDIDNFLSYLKSLAPQGQVHGTVDRRRWRPVPPSSEVQRWLSD
jgi:mono/diheme cytochrome c family protein